MRRGKWRRWTSSGRSCRGPSNAAFSLLLDAPWASAQLRLLVVRCHRVEERGGPSAPSDVRGLDVPREVPVPMHVVEVQLGRRLALQVVCGRSDRSRRRWHEGVFWAECRGRGRGRGGRGGDVATAAASSRGWSLRWTGHLGRGDRVDLGRGDRVDVVDERSWNRSRSRRGRRRRVAGEDSRRLRRNLVLQRRDDAPQLGELGGRLRRRGRQRRDGDSLSLDESRETSDGPTHRC
mmetsp:Transcript_19304/g.62057  ORF Transcript_19304/g.62057 Transcript_19304/m.62057 type:complete len:235 (+) Transcript_19304:346-1050(+)